MTAPRRHRVAELGLGERQTKLAGTAAEEIIGDVIGRGWPTGAVLGSERDLTERYGISRAVFREAVRLVEHQRVAKMRRGPGGGLIVCEPDLGAVSDTVAVHLLRTGATVDEVFDARIVLEEMVAERAPGRLREADIGALRTTVSTETLGTESTDLRALHSQLAAITGNPVLQLFVETLNEVARFYFNDADAVTAEAFIESHHAHEHIARAVITNKPDLARTRMHKHLHAEVDYIRALGNTVEVLDPDRALAHPSGNMRAERIARSIFRRVTRQQLGPGAHLGSEPGLMHEHSASRGILREAIRILEHQHIAMTRRGPRGGLFVTAPSVGAVARLIAIHLRRMGVEPRHLAEVRTGLDLAILEWISTHPKTETRAALAAALTEEGEHGYTRVHDRGRDVHTVLAQSTGNRVLELVHRVVLHLAGALFQHAARRPLSAAESAAIHSAHLAIGAALADGDHDLAMHRMRRHLEAVAATDSAH